ncbi:hypothetical protein MYK68_11540 [Gordonia sp. PP30]|uniref:hypothetical protein n=1 Tax=Gordonia sp. PP30 TaxID=2935861 RepID=UPI001FFEE1AF|nr:hypothetical protein [Gordonia sp. PP30]UQE73399.1 hypothetical protein MYK68_11540 [Gordonia sp. PP30]
MTDLYTKATADLAGAWVAGLNGTADVLPKIRSGVSSAVAAVPGLDKVLAAKPKRLPGVPSLAEVVAVNYAAAERLLAAQRDLALAATGAVSSAEKNTTGH